MRFTDLKSPLCGLAFRLNRIGATAAFAAEAHTAADLDACTGPRTGVDWIATPPADSGVDARDRDRG